MGIPRLTSHIRPYLVSTALGCSTPECQDHLDQRKGDRTVVVIDGPGLAYYIYYRLLAHKRHFLNALDAVPSYGELGTAVLLFLYELEKHGAVIEKIYFDGYLPQWKRDTRISRLEKHRQDVDAFQSANSKHLTICGEYSHAGDTTASQIYNTSQTIPSSLRGLPAAPFLVPAVLDALRNSHHAAITEVVPDEADPYCAIAAKESGAVVLTGDSDFLAHDLGDHGGVAFFNGLELRKKSLEPGSPDTCETIKVAMCRPRDLALQLKVDSLQRLAFEIKEDQSIAFSTALSLAKMPTGKPDSLKSFLADYDTDYLNIINPSLTHGNSAISFKQSLDPQVSEYILQAVTKPQEDVCIYLPCVIDDPSKSSAWSVSTTLRFFAYSLAFQTKPDDQQARKTISEFSRKGSRIVNEEVTLLSETQIFVYAENLTERLIKTREKFNDYPEHITWRLFALLEILAWHHNFNKHPPSRKILIPALTGSTSAAVWTWEDIHLSAQIQAVLYSLRMIKQTLMHMNPATKAPFPTPLVCLGRLLSALPLLAQLLPSRLELSTHEPPADDVWDRFNLLAGIFNGLEDGQDVQASSNTGMVVDKNMEFQPAKGTNRKKKWSKKRRDKARKVLDGHGPVNSAKANMYSVLSNE